MHTELRVPAGFYSKYGKRLLELTLVVPLLVFLAPLMLLTALVVRVALGAPVLFRQERVGRDGAVFRLSKFRTMTDARDAAGRLLPDAERLTAVGLFLRRWSLDELPQLLDVLRGDLALIGPRPLLVRYLPRYSARQRLRHAVRPGITGWAQVNGRNLLGWNERFEHDLWYIENQSLALDLAILARTAKKLFAADEVAAGGGRDVEEFWGEAGAPAGAPRSMPSDETDRPSLAQPAR